MGTGKLRVGAPVYATAQGLGYLAKSFFDAGIITHPLVIRHSSRANYNEWYNSTDTTFADPAVPLRLKSALQNLARRVDVMLFFETPYDWSIIPYCRGVGVKTVFIPMYECTPRDQLNHSPHPVSKNPHPMQPDLILNPSDLDQEYFPQGIRCQIPVEDSIIKKGRLRTTATTFVHNAGHGGLKGRNGTAELLVAFSNYVKSPAKLILRTQKPIDHKRSIIWDENISDRQGVTIEVRTGTYPREQLYSEGDVFIFPEKFNGLSLPMQEAYASGMMVMATARQPNTGWLPLEPLIPVSKVVDDCVSGRCYNFKSAVLDPKVIAECIDRWYGQDITLFSQSGLNFAQSNSWAVLGPWYVDVLTKLRNGV